MFTGGQPLIQEQGHPHQVLSMETRPICTPPASLSARLQPRYIFTAFSQSCPQNPPAQASCGDSPSTTGAGALFSSGSGGGLTSPPPPPSRSPAPTASSQPSPGSAEGVCAPRPWAAARAAPDCNSQFTGRIWPQVIAPAASGSPRLALLPGNKSPKRSSYKVSIQLIMDLQEKAAPDPKYLLWSAPLRRHQWFFSRLC